MKIGGGLDLSSSELLLCEHQVAPHVGQLGLQDVHTLPVSDYVDSLDPHGLGNLDDRLAHSTVGPVLDQPVARLEGDEV